MPDKSPAEELIDSIRQKLETEVVPVYLSKIRWAQVVGLLMSISDHIKTGEYCADYFQGDVRLTAIDELITTIRKGIGIEE